jgi:hypothetical protein
MRDVNSRREPFLGQQRGVVNLNGTAADASAPSAPFLRVDREVVRAYLTEMYLGVPGPFQVWTDPRRGSGQFFETTEDGIEQAVTRIEADGNFGEQSIYSRMTTLSRLPDIERGKRGGADLSSHFIALWTDLDYGTVGHENGDKLPPDEAAAQAIYDASGLPPASITVNSGGGLYHIVKLTEPVDVTDDAVRMKIAALARRWQYRVKAVAEEHGYDYGTGVSDLSRVLRIPGTVNAKIWKNRRPVTFTSSGLRYTLEELEAACPAPPRSAARPVTVGSEPAADATGRFDQLLNEMRSTRSERNNALNRLAYWCFQYAAAGQLNEAEVEREFIAAGLATGLEEREVYGTVNSARTAGLSRPYVWMNRSRIVQTAEQHDMWAAEQFDADGHVVDAAPGTTPTTGTAGPQAEPEAEWVEPIPLEEEQPPAYDLSKLGELGAYAQATAQALSVPYGMSLLTHLGAVSAAVGGRRRVLVRPKWKEAVVLHALALAPPGSKKSPAQAEATAPLKAQEKLRQGKDQAAVAMDAMRRELLEERIKEARKRAVLGKTQSDRVSAEADLEDLVTQQVEMGPPKELTRLTASDVTPEELAYLMDRHGGRMAILDSEATFLSVISGRYSQGGKPKLELTLSAYDHQSVTVDRVSKQEPVMLENPSLTISLAIQGDAITSLGKSTAEMDKKGAWGRFMYDVSSGRALRTRYTPEIPEEVEEAHKQRVWALMKACYDDTEIRDMTLSDEAADIFFAYYKETDPAYRADHHRVRIQGWDEKQPGRIIRIAALRTLYEDPHALEIPADIMRDVVSLDATMTAHAHKAAGFMQLSDRDPLEPARDVLDWLKGEMFTRPVKASEVQAAMRRKRRPWCNRLDDVLDALTALSEYHYIGFRVRPDGSRDNRLFKVHPLLAGDPVEETTAPEETPPPVPEAASPTVEDTAEEESVEEMKMRKSAQSFGRFLAEFCETGPQATHWVTAQELMEAFGSYDSDDGWLNPVRFGKIIRRILPDVERSKRRVDGKPTPVYKGIRIIPES